MNEITKEIEGLHKKISAVSHSLKDADELIIQLTNCYKAAGKLSNTEKAELQMDTRSYTDNQKHFLNEIEPIMCVVKYIKEKKRRTYKYRVLCSTPNIRV